MGETTAIAKYLIKGILRESKAMLAINAVTYIMAFLLLLTPPPQEGAEGIRLFFECLLCCFIAIPYFAILGSATAKVFKLGWFNANRANVYSMLHEEDVLNIYPYVDYATLIKAKLLTFSVASLMFSGFVVMLAAAACALTPVTILPLFATLIAAWVLPQLMVVALGFIGLRSVLLAKIVYSLLWMASVASITGYVTGVKWLAYILPPMSICNVYKLEPVALASTAMLTAVVLSVLRALPGLEHSVKPFDEVKPVAEVVFPETTARVLTVDAFVDALLGKTVYIGTAIVALVPALVNMVCIAMYGAGVIDMDLLKAVAIGGGALFTALFMLIPVMHVVEDRCRTIGFTGWFFESSGLSIDGMVSRLVDKVSTILTQVCIPVAIVYAALTLVSSHFAIYAFILATIPFIIPWLLKPYGLAIAKTAFKATLKSTKVPSVVPSNTLVERTLWMELLGKKQILVMTGYVLIWFVLFFPLYSLTAVTLYEMVTGVSLGGRMTPPFVRLCYLAAGLAVGLALAWLLSRLLVKIAEATVES